MKLPDLIDYVPRLPYDKTEIEQKIQEIETSFPESQEKAEALERLRRTVNYIETGDLPELKISQ